MPAPTRDASRHRGRGNPACLTVWIGCRTEAHALMLALSGDVTHCLQLHAIKLLFICKHLPLIRCFRFPISRIFQDLRNSIFRNFIFWKIFQSFQIFGNILCPKCWKVKTSQKKRLKRYTIKLLNHEQIVNGLPMQNGFLKNV